jgi:hypothetical protein
VRKGGRKGNEDGKIDAIEEEEEVEGTTGVYGEKHCMASHRLIGQTPHDTTRDDWKTWNTLYQPSYRQHTTYPTQIDKKPRVTRTSYTLSRKNTACTAHIFITRRFSTASTSKSSHPNPLVLLIPTIYIMPASPTNLIQQQHSYVPLREDPLSCVTKYTLRFDTIPKPRKQEGKRRRISAKRWCKKLCITN